MEFILAELDENKYIFNKAIEDLRKKFRDHEGFCYIKHPLFEINNGSNSVLIISRFFGTILIDIYDFGLDNIEKIDNQGWHFKNYDWEEIKIFEDVEDKISKIQGKILSTRELRKFSEKDSRLTGQYFVYTPKIKKNDFKDNFDWSLEKEIIFTNEFESKIDELIDKYKIKIPEDIWKIFNGILSGAHILKKPKRKVSTESSKAGIIRKIEDQIESFDIDQMKVAQQIPPGPQRIRGLAGTGKTIILALKAVHMHLEHPEWTIIYTFNTQSLYNYIHELIRKFYQYWTGGLIPNWDNLKILHGWGGKGKEGLYSYISKIMKKSPKTYTEAMNFFEFKRNSELLGKCCLELKKSGLPQIINAILIDEAQDFDKGFFQFCYALLIPPKKLIWAYDELQSLEDISIPTAKEIFGVDEKDIPLINLEGLYPGGIEKDFVLQKAYRNPRIILMTAHLFGMGLLRENGAIQFLPNKGSWQDLGYKILDGEFKKGSVIKITRPIDNSPNLIEDYVSLENLFKILKFERKVNELQWISNQIENDIKKENLRPDDIVVIGIDNNKLFPHFRILQNLLRQKGINCSIVGADVGKDTFFVPNNVSLSTVFKAKGNEAVSIYILDFEYSENKSDIIRSRNMAFSSITRSKGWVTITGTGENMNKVKRELEKIIKQYPECQFEVPDMNKIKRQLNNIEYEKRRVRIKKAEETLKKALKIISETNGIKELTDEVKKKIKEMADEIKKSEGI